MTEIQANTVVEPVTALPVLPEADPVRSFRPIETLQVECLIIGGGPAGLSAAIELGQRGVKPCWWTTSTGWVASWSCRPIASLARSTLVMPAHAALNIATRLAGDVSQYESVSTWLNSTVVAVYTDHKVGIVRDGHEYVLIEPQVLLVATVRAKSH